MKYQAFKMLSIFILIILYSCKEKTKLDSEDFKYKNDRIEVLSKNIKSGSEIYDAEFKLFNVNGFANSRSVDIPGASSWNYEFVVKIDTESTKKWLETFTETKSINSDLSWTNKIIRKRKENWNTSSKPQFFKRQNEDVVIVLYQKEGILYKAIRNL